MGADFSLPITPTASFVATVHPDYSNVEVDQQTIAPSAFPYQYQEVRPFFSQAGQAFNHTAVSCIQCPQLLYTPAIPTFHTGYAIEGTQGPLRFSAFDAVGNGRLDKALALDFGRSNTDRAYAVNLQHIAVDGADGLHDDTTSLTAGYQNQRNHLFAYGFGALERGSQVTSPASALFGEAGVGYADASSILSVAYDTVGPQFAPVDAYVQQSDVRGYEGIAQKQFNFSPKAFVHALSVSAVATSFVDHAGNPAQRLFQSQIGVDLRNSFSARVYGGRQAIEAYDGGLLPFNANGALIGYRIDTGTPSYISYAGGSFFDGSLDSWTYATTVPLKPTVHFSLEVDGNKYFTRVPNEFNVSQWLQRATLDWQISHDAALDLGVRRIVGGSLPNAFAPPNFAYVNATNLSAAFHLLTLRNEFYVVYGDPNALTRAMPSTSSGPLRRSAERNMNQTSDLRLRTCDSCSQDIAVRALRSPRSPGTAAVLPPALRTLWRSTGVRSRFAARACRCCAQATRSACGTMCEPDMRLPDCAGAGPLGPRGPCIAEAWSGRGS